MNTKDAVNHLIKEFKKDKEYREVWEANVAMAYMDSYGNYKNKTGKKSMSNEDLHAIATNASKYFLMQLCNEIKYPKGR